MSSTTDQLQQTGSQLAPAQDPQVSTSQTIKGTGASPQTDGTFTLDSSQQATISSVGVSSKLTPFSNTPDTSAITAVKPPKTDHHYPVIIGAGVVVLICVLACVWMVRSSQKSIKKK